jgi:3-methyl-2-oxobutanoate hydroxymethyltransferase
MRAEDFKGMKARGEKIPALTAYDYPMARLLDEAGIPLLLVGDSLGMVVLGYPDTTLVTLADMIHHTRAVTRAKPSAFVVADLPFQTYETPEEAVTSARALLAAGANAVKLEGGETVVPQIQALRAENIEVMGHLGMLPQQVRVEGGYTIKGKDAEGRERLMREAQLLEEAGVFAIVLELVTPLVAEGISRLLTIPTIGIGSGRHCDGQILVTPDLVGSFPWFRPKFVQPRAAVGIDIQQAARAFAAAVRAGD